MQVSIPQQTKLNQDKKIKRPSNAELQRCDGCAWCDGKTPEYACSPCHFCSVQWHGASDGGGWIDEKSLAEDPVVALTSLGYQLGRVRICHYCEYQFAMEVKLPATGNQARKCNDSITVPGDGGGVYTGRCNQVATRLSYDAGHLRPTCDAHTWPKRPLACLYWSHHSKTTDDTSQALKFEYNCPDPSCFAFGSTLDKIKHRVLDG